MKFKLYTVALYVSNEQTRSKYRFPWQQTTLNNGIYKMQIVIDLEAFNS